MEGDSNWYGKTWVRALSAAECTEAATRCGVNVVSSDYTNPDDMKMFVWSWDQKEPKSTDSSKYCAAMLPSGRWASLDCSMKLPYACASPTTPGQAVTADLARQQWSVDLNTLGPWKGDQAPCTAGFAPSVPHNGFTNSLLTVAAYGQTVWLNTPLSI